MDRTIEMQSIIQVTNSCNFPPPSDLKVYMEPFFKREGLPEKYSGYQKTVDAMLDGVNTDLPIYLMIDEKFVRRGSAQRREGLHIDGYWSPPTNLWGNEPSRPWRPISAHGPAPSGHGSTPSHRPVGGHRSIPAPGGHGSIPLRHGSGVDSWETASFDEPEGIILASSLKAARGFVGDFTGPIREGGDCSHIDLSTLHELPMLSHTVYAGNVTALHESLPVTQDSYRQLIRLNVPGWTVQ